MRTNLTDGQRELLAHRRNQVVGLLRVTGDPCPGCLEPVTAGDAEFHHIPWRQSDSYSFEQDLLLLDPCNGVLAHHACHMKEGWDFQLRASLLLWQRVSLSTLRKFRVRLEKQGITARDWPPALWAVIDTMAHNSSRQWCPSCYSFHLHELRNPPGKVGAPIDGDGPLRATALCWSCLRLFPAGQPLTGG